MFGIPKFSEDGSHDKRIRFYDDILRLYSRFAIIIVFLIIVIAFAILIIYELFTDQDFSKLLPLAIAEGGLGFGAKSVFTWVFSERSSQVDKTATH